MSNPSPMVRWLGITGFAGLLVSVLCFLLGPTVWEWLARSNLFPTPAGARLFLVAGLASSLVGVAALAMFHRRRPTSDGFGWVLVVLVILGILLALVQGAGLGGQVAGRALQRARLLPQVDRHVEFREAPVEHEGRKRHARGGARRQGVILERQHHLEQGMPVQ